MADECVLIASPASVVVRSQSFHIALHVGSFAEPGVFLLPGLSLIGMCLACWLQVPSQHVATNMLGCAHRVTPADATLREFLCASILFKSLRSEASEALSKLVDFFVKSCIQWAALRVVN